MNVENIAVSFLADEGVFFAGGGKRQHHIH